MDDKREQGPSSAKDANNNRKKTVLDAAAWPRASSTVMTLCRFFFGILEFISRVKEHLKIGLKGGSNLAIRSIGERTLVSRQNSLQRKSSKEILDQWLSIDNSCETKVYAYLTVAEAVESFVVAILFAAHGKHSARTFLSDPNKVETTAGVLRALKSIQVRAKKSVKFRFLFKPLLSFLSDLENSRVSSVTDFIQMLAENMLRGPDSWYLQFVHARARANNTPQNIYETTLATLSLFFQEGAGLESFLLRGGWKSPERTTKAALTLIMYCAVLKCAPTAIKEINVTEFTDVERILMASSDQKFTRLVSRSFTKSTALKKDKMMWDITLNCCNEYVESAWSDASLERAIWTLEYGRKHIGRELYNKLKQLNGKRKLDLTPMSPICLVAFSLSGMIRFEGLDDCVYRATEAEDARIHLHGNLPMPTVQDLVRLNVVQQLKEELFIVNPLPGSERSFKTVRIGDRLRLVSSLKPETFNATLEQRIG